MNVRQKRYEELQDKLNALSDDEQDFIAWLSVRNLQESFEIRMEDMNRYPNDKTIGEQFYVAECARVLKYVADELGNDLF